MNIKESRRLNEARTLKNSNDEKLIDTLKKAVDRGQEEIETELSLNIQLN